MMVYAIGTMGIGVTAICDKLMNAGRVTGNGSGFWFLVVISLGSGVYFLSDYRKQPIEIELTPDGITLRAQGFFKWSDIAHIYTEQKGIRVYSQYLVVELRGGKKMLSDISDLEIAGKELLELIHQYVEAGKKNT